MKKLCIVGLGWLGKQVAEACLENGIELLALGRSKPENTPFDFFFLDLNAPILLDNWPAAFFDFDCLLFTIPPSGIDKYAEQAAKLLEEIALRNNHFKVIFTSSISVYGNQNGVLDEGTDLNPQSSNAKAIVELENWLSKNFKDSSSILRLGGLVGPNRHPVHYLSGRQNLKGGQAYVNLIHAQDIVAFILRQVKQPFHSGPVNLVSPEHPVKAAFYRQVAAQLNLQLPEFDSEDEESGKKVNSIVLKELIFDFKYRSPNQYPESLFTQ